MDSDNRQRVFLYDPFIKLDIYSKNILSLSTVSYAPYTKKETGINLYLFIIICHRKTTYLLYLFPFVKHNSYNMFLMRACIIMYHKHGPNSLLLNVPQANRTERLNSWKTLQVSKTFILIVICFGIVET